MRVNRSIKVHGFLDFLFFVLAFFCFPFNLILSFFSDVSETSSPPGGSARAVSSSARLGTSGTVWGTFLLGIGCDEFVRDVGTGGTGGFLVTTIMNVSRYREDKDRQCGTVSQMRYSTVDVEVEE